jgi:hypothetical protein
MPYHRRENDIGVSSRRKGERHNRNSKPPNRQPSPRRGRECVRGRRWEPLGPYRNDDTPDFGTMYAVAHRDRVVTVQECGPSPNFPVEWPWPDPVNFRHHITIARHLLLSTTTTADGGDGSAPEPSSRPPRLFPSKAPIPRVICQCVQLAYWNRSFNNR